MRTHFIHIFATVALFCAAAPAWSHPGPRIWIGNVNGVITTYSSDNDLAPTSYTCQRIFVGGGDEGTLLANGRLDEYPVPGTNLYAAEFPGYQVRLDHSGDGADGGINYGTTFSFRIAGPLLVFNDTHPGTGAASGFFATSQSQFGGTGHVPQIALVGDAEEGGNPGNLAITANSVVNGFDFYAYGSPTDDGHLIAALLPNGSFPSDGSAPGDGPHVVYAVPFVLTAPGYADSAVFYLLYGRDIGYLSDGPDQQIFLDAVQVANAALVSGPCLPCPTCGDMNCDGVTNLSDISGFAQAMVDPAGYSATHPGCNILNADMNRDGVVDGRDIALMILSLVH